MASSETKQYGEWTDDPHYTTDCHYTDVREELTRWLRGDHDGWNNWLVYTRLEHTDPPTLINFAYIHASSGPEVEQFVERICQLVETGAITKDVSEAVSGACYVCNAQSSNSLSTFVTDVAAADSTPPVADPVLGLAASASDTKFCTNRKEGIQAGDCSKTKGFGYASAHNCGGGNHYSCKRGGNVECLTLKAAKKQGLEGGYCYTE
ncbi:Serine threonine protein kinase [Lasiodiplodia theobromae]|uniref:Serine threonine protein kinase n=1 Tax=Lasiodiplodia theobromae TaxID=45133 RepID=UPI0015C2FD79|nr:Serine threonine protein kinase [Lasiodiplodia theobromae]KAF4537881.1 Serine threonine protein kinase [Lasiodiplodia theobromae]